MKRVIRQSIPAIYCVPDTVTGAGDTARSIGNPYILVMETDINSKNKKRKTKKTDLS